MGGLGGNAAKPAAQDKPKFGDLQKDPIGRGPAANAAKAKEPSSDEEYEDDFELGESIANLADKGSAKKNAADQFDLDDFFAPGKGTGNGAKPSDKDSEPPAFDDNYEDYTYNF